MSSASLVVTVMAAAATSAAAAVIGAVFTVLHARWYAHLPNPTVVLLLAVGPLAARMVSS